MTGRTTGWAVLGVVAALCAAAWLLPGDKPEAIAGRYSYGQALLTALASAAVLSMLVLALGGFARRAAFRLLAVWLAVALAVGAAELWAYAWPVAHLRDNPWYIKTGRGIALDPELPFARPPYLHWRGRSRGDLAMRPGDRDPYAPVVTFQTDHEGFRNSRDMTQADLVFLGDSFTEAGNVDEAHTFVQLVAQRTGRSARNLGRAGYMPSAELVVLRRYALPMQPGVVVWQIAEANDLEESAMYARWLDAGRPAYRITIEDDLSHADAWRRRSPTRRLFDAWRDVAPWPLRGTLASPDGRATPMRFLTRPGRRHTPEAHPGWPVLAEALRQGAAVCREHDIQLIVLFVPMKIRVLGPHVQWADEAQSLLGDDWLPTGASTFAAHLAELCAALDVPFVDATDALSQAAAAGTVVYLPFDTHLAPDGHTAVADLLTPMVK